MEIVTLKSFAKINLGLNIISKRPDGFHDIETIFYPVQLHDEILIQKSNSSFFESNIEILNSNADNLIIKAKQKLEEYLNKIFSVKINLKKFIPLGAGLGGGSSNAASILLGLNQLFNLNLSGEELFNIAVQLGSDVPFFLDPEPSFAYGKGEILKKINFEIPYPILVINPGIHVSTPWAYSKVIPKKPELNLYTIVENGINNFSKLKGIIKNDFEEIVFRKYPEIKELKQNLYDLGAEFALMTGSGSTFFGIFPNLDEAKKAADILADKYFTFVHFEK